MNHHFTVLICAIIGLVIVNVAAYRYLGVWGLFVTAGSWPIVQKLFDLYLKL